MRRWFPITENDKAQVYRYNLHQTEAIAKYLGIALNAQWTVKALVKFGQVLALKLK